MRIGVITGVTPNARASLAGTSAYAAAYGSGRARSWVRPRGRGGGEREHGGAHRPAPRSGGEPWGPEGTRRDKRHEPSRREIERLGAQVGHDGEENGTQADHDRERLTHLPGHAAPCRPRD